MLFAADIITLDASAIFMIRQRCRRHKVMPFYARLHICQRARVSVTIRAARGCYDTIQFLPLIRYAVAISPPKRYAAADVAAADAAARAAR